MLADDSVIYSESRKQVEEDLHRWRYALERREMKASRHNMCLNWGGRLEGAGRKVRLQGVDVVKVDGFKYQEPTIQIDEECSREGKKRVPAGWSLNSFFQTVGE